MSGLRVVVLGYIVRGPLGGLAWHNLQYVLGLAQLGHDVLFVEDSDDYDSCYDPARGVMGTDPSYGLAFAAQAFGRLGLGDRWAYFDGHRARWHGRADAEEWSAGADVLLDVSGVNPIRPWAESIPARALVDTDPVFTQLRNAYSARDAERAAAHTHFFTFAASPEAALPPDDRVWRPTRQPVALGAWPVSPGPRDGPFTTVMQWQAHYPAREHGGVHYGTKAESFEPYIDLPRRVRPTLELALGGETAPRERLTAAGWRVIDPLPPSHDPWTYQRYLRRSKAELSVAKHGYVVAGTGWFSERSAGYLASGRPTVLQDTGFTRWLPTGLGLLAFSSPDEAVDAIEDVERRYPEHCRAARALVEEHFRAEHVLGDLLAALD